MRLSVGSPPLDIITFSDFFNCHLIFTGVNLIVQYLIMEFCKKIMINRTTFEFYCPLCEEHFELSEYLFRQFEDDDRLIWLSNMVTHYRHTHITSWNKCWGDNGHYYRRRWFTDYDAEKSIVNERAKRQIIRKCRLYMIANNIDVFCFDRLQGTSLETKSLAIKKLDPNHKPSRKPKNEKNKN